MINLISRTDGRIAITILGIATLLLLTIFMVPILRVEASHCTAGAITPCTEDVRNTKHNLSANTDILVTGTTEVCIFCHTPHGGQKSNSSGLSNGAFPQAPLWNRAIKTTTGTYTAYSGPNFDAQGTTPGTPKGVSLACLSCHDGSISFDALVNPAGSGGFIPGNLTDTSGSGTSMGMTFTGPGVDATNSMKEGNRPQQLTGGSTGGLNNFVSPGAGEGMEPYPNLTLDLRDDHPISMQMPSTDPQFNDALNNRSANVDGGAGNDGVKISFVSRYTAADRIWSTDKRDRIRLYPSVSSEGVSQYVECASCHNPHTPRPLFLRLPTINKTEFPGGADFTGGGFGTQLVSTTSPFTPVFNGSGSAEDLSHKPNQGSLVCLSCHQK